MRLVEKTGTWDHDKTFVGKKKGWKVTLTYSSCNISRGTPYWYFLLRKDNAAYNSLWEKLKYSTKEECLEAAESKIDAMEKALKEKK